MGGAMNVVLCCVGGKIFVVYSVNGTTKPPSWHQNPHRSSFLPPFLPPPHTLHSFILYLYELPFSTTDNCTNKSCKIFRKMETSTRKTILLMTTTKKKKKKKMMMRMMIESTNTNKVRAFVSSFFGSRVFFFFALTDGSIDLLVAKSMPLPDLARSFFFLPPSLN